MVALLTLAAAAAAVASASAATTLRGLPSGANSAVDADGLKAMRPLPSGAINAAYADVCDDKVVTAVQNGLNVVIWAFVNFGADAQGKTSILLDQMPDLDCVASTWHTLNAQGLNTTFMISLGGWGSPHPIVYDADNAYATWKQWNEQTVARNGWPGFDGFDVDIEGVNTLNSPENALPIPLLDMIGKFCEKAKADGYRTSLVPPESYLDQTYSGFNTALTNIYPSEFPTFKYHGRNGYAYLASRYGGSAEQPTFDFVTIQLYESYAHALYNTTIGRQSADEYLAAYIPRVYEGWMVDFSSVPAANWTSRRVAVPPQQLVIGLANGWADPTRCFLVMPDLVGKAYAKLAAAGMAPRGFAFWRIEDEGDVPTGGNNPLYLAAGLNAFLHTRA